MRARAVVIGGVAGLAAGLGFLYWLIGTEHKADPARVSAAIEATTAVAAVWPTKVTKKLAAGELAAFVVKPDRQPVPDIRFNNEKNEGVSLSQWRGRVVLVNLWATWCAPCRKEMPALAALQKQLGGKDFEVLAISVDRKGADASAAFLIENNATALQLLPIRAPPHSIRCRPSACRPLCWSIARDARSAACSVPPTGRVPMR